MLLEIDKELYQDCMAYEKGEMVMFLELLKALYRTIQAACLFWEKLSKKLMEWGSLSTHMTVGLQTRWSMVHNLLWYGMSMT